MSRREELLITLSELEAYREEQDCNWYFNILKEQGVVTEEERPVHCGEDVYYKIDIEAVKDRLDDLDYIREHRVNKSETSRTRRDRRVSRAKRLKNINKNVEHVLYNIYFPKENKDGKVYYKKNDMPGTRRYAKRNSTRKIRRYNKHYIPKGKWCNKLYAFWDDLY